MENAQKLIQLHDLKFKPYLTEEVIKLRVQEIGKKISKDFGGKNPLFVAILNGSFMFAADLLKSVDLACEISFIKASSYSGTESTKELHISLGPNDEFNGRDIIIIEDIVDSGHSLSKLLPLVKHKNPSSVTIASLLYKPAAFQADFKIDYIGFEIPNDFIVGYGLDYNGLGRNLKDIYVLA
jgi:hypoxanthine phosphoribosyltransferase